MFAVRTAIAVDGGRSLGDRLRAGLQRIADPRSRATKASDFKGFPINSNQFQSL